jgi:hypothetical protein
VVVDTGRQPVDTVVDAIIERLPGLLTPVEPAPGA